MFQVLTSHLKARIDAAVRSAACALFAATAVAIALALFCAAGFVALAARLGAIDACLVFGGAFLLVGAGAGVCLLVLKRRAARTQPSLVQAMADPRIVALGAELVRLLGGRRAASAGLLGAFVIGLLLSRGAPKR